MGLLAARRKLICAGRHTSSFWILRAREAMRIRHKKVTSSFPKETGCRFLLKTHSEGWGRGHMTWPTWPLEKSLGMTQIQLWLCLDGLGWPNSWVWISADFSIHRGPGITRAKMRFHYNALRYQSPQQIMDVNPTQNKVMIGMQNMIGNW